MTCLSKGLPIKNLIMSGYECMTRPQHQTCAIYLIISISNELLHSQLFVRFREVWNVRDSYKRGLPRVQNK